MYQETKFLFILSLIFLVTIDTCRGQECDSVLAGSGTIISEGHPTEYPSYFDCKWTIEARSFDVVDISFKDFHIELGETCEFDSLEITAMGQRNKFCGTSLSRLPNNGRLRYRGRVELRMRSDDSVNLRGISLNYKVTPGEPPAETTPAPEISTPNPTTSPLTTTPAPILTCDDKPCQNEGECTMVDEVEFYCFCEDGFEGDLCEINIDDCASNPCKNGGTCVDGVKRWTCECIEGYIGETCGINFDDCRASPCKNGGTCEDRVNAFHCVCARGWTDYDCSIDIDECTPNPCKNYGVCENHLGYHSCICHPKYTGENCTISVEPTSSPPLFHPRTTVLPDEAAPLENPETTILPYEATPQEKTQNPTIGDGDSEETTSAPGITPDVTITTDLSTISSSTPAPTVGKLTDDTPGEEDDSLSLDLLPETEAPFDPAIESLPKEKEAKLQLTPEPHGDIEHVTKNPATNHSHQFPNATETPLGEGNVNGNETLLNTTSFPNESTETEDEESYFPTSIVATITTIATVGGLVGSVLYYCKSAFQSKKVEPSGRGQHSRGI